LIRLSEKSTSTSGFLGVKKLIPPKRHPQQKNQIKKKRHCDIAALKGAHYRPIKTAVSVHPYFSDHQEENEQDENKKNEKNNVRA